MKCITAMASPFQYKLTSSMPCVTNTVSFHVGTISRRQPGNDKETGRRPLFPVVDQAGDRLGSRETRISIYRQSTAHRVQHVFAP